MFCLLRIFVSIYAKKILAKETDVFLAIAVLWCFPLKWNEFSLRINRSKHSSQVICRNRRVVLVEIFIRSANYSFYDIFAMIYIL